jgi:hypothetical protein
MGIFGERSRLSRSLALILASALLCSSSTALAQAAGDAKSHRIAGETAATKKDFAKAIEEFKASYAMEKTPEALEGIAYSNWELQKWTDAYEAYDEYLTTYSAKLPKNKKDLAQRRLRDLADKTGALAIDATEVGADVFVDDKNIGKTPLPKPLRLMPGPHRVRVLKEGYLPWEQAPNVTANGATPVAVKLEFDNRKAHLNVKEQNGQPVHVFIDNVDVGPAPWSGDLDAGDHDVVVKSNTMLAAPQKVSVAKGESKDVILTAAATVATLKVTTADGKGVIYLDGKVVGEGVFSQEIPAGPHKLAVKRDGYDTFEEDVVLKEKETASRSVTLILSQVITTGQVKKEEDRLEGFYLGLGASYLFMPDGNGNDIQHLCENKTAGTHCTPDAIIGAALHGYVGYHWNPVGLELFFQPGYDQTTPSVQYDASPVNLNADPARKEDYGFRRVGAAVALRARLTMQTGRIRGSFAAGPGAAYRQVLFTRDASADISGSHYTDHFFGSSGYFAPDLSMDAHVGFRAGRALELLLGYQVLFESPRAFGEKVTIEGDPCRMLANGSLPPTPAGLACVPSIPGQTIPISTPTYQLLTGTQTFMGLYLGLQFGP